MNDAITVLLHARIVGDHHHGTAILARQCVQQRRHMLAGFAIQRRRRFVGEQDRRRTDQCPGNRHPLFLATGQFRRMRMRAFTESEPFQQLQRTFAIGNAMTLAVAMVFDIQCQRDVFPGTQGRKQVVVLENETKVLPAQRAQLFAIKFAECVAKQFQLAGGRRQQTAHDLQQRGFAGTGRADQQCHFTGANIKIDPRQRVHGRFAATVGVIDAAQLQRQWMGRAHR